MLGRCRPVSGSRAKGGASVGLVSFEFSLLEHDHFHSWNVGNKHVEPGNATGSILWPVFAFFSSSKAAATGDFVPQHRTLSFFPGSPVSFRSQRAKMMLFVQGVEQGGSHFLSGLAQKRPCFFF